MLAAMTVDQLVQKSVEQKELLSVYVMAVQKVVLMAFQKAGMWVAEWVAAMAAMLVGKTACWKGCNLVSAMVALLVV